MHELFQLTEEQKLQGTNEIKAYFLAERDEDLGDLAAMLILDFICDKFGPYFYNMGIGDAKYYLQEKMEDIYSLEK